MFIRPSPSAHPRFDLEMARRHYAASGHDRELAPEAITSPIHVVAVEHLRDLHGLRVGSAEPTDVFVFARGEPPRWDLTQVGGMPYWPADRPWPTNADGEPCGFLAQVNFQDSRDLVGDLPGDVLVLLTNDVDPDDWLFQERPVRFEWVSAGIAPIEEFDSDRVVVPGGPFYGVIHRTADYPEARGASGTAALRQSYLLAELAGTKIGGIPHLIQGDRDGFTGELLFQLGSIQPAPGVPYPWVDLPEPLSRTPGADDYAYGEDHSFVLADAGMLYVVRHRSGELRAWCEYY